MARPPSFVAPVLGGSWATPSSHYVPSDGTRPLDVLYHLRGQTGEPADGFGKERFHAWLDAPAGPIEPSRLDRVAPGLWAASFAIPKEAGGSAVTLRATFDGVAVVAETTLPVAADPWLASYPSSASGASCAAATGRASTDARSPSLLFVLALALGVVRRRRGS
jgi:MYXO-CTERM domain-containing protein